MVNEDVRVVVEPLCLVDLFPLLLPQEGLLQELRAGGLLFPLPPWVLMLLQETDPATVVIAGGGGQNRMLGPYMERTRFHCRFSPQNSTIFVSFPYKRHDFLTFSPA